MGLRDVPRNTQSEARSTAIAIARGLHSIERLEYTLQLLGRNAWPIVIDSNHDSGPGILQVDPRAAAKFDCILDEVRQTAFQSLRLSEELALRAALHAHLATHLGEFRLQRPQQGIDVHRRERLVVVE